MISMVSSEAFGGLTFADFSAKNILAVLAVMISSSLIEYSLIFPLKATHLYITDFHYHIVESKAYCSIAVVLYVTVAP